ncbi:DUF5682 family protein [Serratia oryzae]|uniref:4-aminobutyrate aminotransferase n=1 Tax=Serratia oryzae TaxID=2034155 RepID=A0A1S8CP50_9GAMM|nr:DUF5682 family protein [Serratia oryzae]OMQ25489.1 4-aminobutyrate aminotransferase [Serratia oryzae]
MDLSSIILPARMGDALEQWQRLQEAQVYFAPIRHHSPACAYAVLSLIESVKPDHVLIEGPDSFNTLIPALLDQQTRPPVAIMGQTESQDEDDNTPRSAYFPFCEYSPEWQALQAGHQQAAKVRFIDLAWSVQRDDDKHDSASQSLQEERYLAHSQFINRLARKCYCRDHDELWEHLFELRAIEALADWQQLFLDTFVWCALARLDYEPEVLEAEGSARREAYMLAHIQTLKQQQPLARIVVVTGGAHTLALIEGMANALPRQFALTVEQQKRFTMMQKQIEKDSAWLIRYSFDRLDALNGYASGMPSPAYYQKSWESLLQQRQENRQERSGAKLSTQHYRAQTGVAFLASVAQTLREKHFDNPPSYLGVKNAAEQSLQLAALRNHPGPGRYDLLDGLQSAFIKGSLDESQQELWQAIKSCFSGNQLGNIPAGATIPPLVAETYARAASFRFKLHDTLIKTARLDIYRNAQHRQRSRFLHLLAFLDIHFAQRVSGPDLLAGHQLDLLFEEWQYAWTPNVEGELIALSEKGVQLEAIALNTLLTMERQLEAQGHSRSSQNAVSLLIQAALIGLQQRIPSLLTLLDRYIQQDSRLDSLTTCGHKLIHLWRCRAFLDITDLTSIKDRLHQLLLQAFFCLDQLAQGDAQQQEVHFQALLALRELITLLPEMALLHDYQHDFHQQLQRLDGALDRVPLLKGAVDAIRYLDSQIDSTILTVQLDKAFSTGSDAEQAVAYFLGIMRAAPELALRLPLLMDCLNRYLAAWDDQQFIRILPELRFAFSQLTPKQNADLAGYIAEVTTLNRQDLSLQQVDFSSTQMLAALQLDQQLQRSLIAQGLRDWFDTATEVGVPDEPAE